MVTKRSNVELFGRSKDVTLKAVSALVKGLHHRPKASWFCYLLENKADNGHHDILNMSINPDWYENAEEFREDYLIASILSKYPFLDVSIDRESEAIKKFLLAEEQCAEANLRLKESYAGGSKHHQWLSEILYLAQRKIGNLLPEFSWEAALPFCGFGPGSSLTLNRAHGDAYYKFGNLMPTTTAGNAGIADWVISTIPAWQNHVFFNDTSPGALKIVPGNRITTVPKNAKTDRIIAVEPDLNMFVQKGIGGLIRRSLKRVGVNLDSQEKNQELAFLGSVHDDLATIDLSSASDTVCTELVEMLLPPDWVDAILSCRCKQGTLPDGTVLTYQKVSSMGNGFTFELESLIFWALCSAVIDSREEVDRRLAIYGDDIVINKRCVPDLSTVLSYCGFTFNESKSFTSGPFRESCGKHYFRGVDVTPFYVRKRIDNPERLFWWCNTIRRYAARNQTFGCDSSYKAGYDYGVSLLPRRLRTPSVPLYSNQVQYSDTALGGDFDEVRPKFDRAVQQYVAEGWVRIYDVKPGHGVPYLLKKLDILEKSKIVDPLSISWERVNFDFKLSKEILEYLRYGVDVRTPVTGVSNQRWVYRKVKTCLPQWGWVGPWL